MKHRKTISDIEEDYLYNHPEEIDNYIDTLFSEYAEDGDSAALLSCLRMVCRVKGVSHSAELQSVSGDEARQPSEQRDAPEFEHIYNLMRAIGYGLVPQKLK